MQGEQNLTLNKPVFFYLSEQSFSHLSICLAEGFKELGIPFYSNINYWKLSDQPEDYLFHHNPDITPDECSIVVLDTKWINSKGDCPENFFHPHRQYVTVYLDEMDGLTIWNPLFEQFDLRFRTHYNKKSKHPDNCTSWVFGLSNRILQQTQDLHQFQDRKSSIVFNFRVKQDRVISNRSWFKFEAGFVFFNSGFFVFENPVRQMATEQLLPLFHRVFNVDDRIEQFDQPPSDSYHALQWQQTGQRHHPNYYQRLKESLACACFAGCVIPYNNSGESLVDWWDSWRFWESLAAGCVTFHVDFDKYAVDLPVMPENWRHYIGIDLEHPQDAIDRIISEPNILEQISTQGRQWAMTHYSPVPTALRFLETISAYQNSKNGFFETSAQSLNPAINLPLRKINLVIFPDWFQPELSLSLALKQILQILANHPDAHDITLLIDNRNKADEEANLILSSVVMDLLIQEEITLGDHHLEIALIGQENLNQWSVLLPELRGRIQLAQEDQKAIAQSQADQIPCYFPDRLNW